MKHKKLSARILSLALSATMLFSMMPTTVFATGGDIPIGASSIEKSEKTITAFDELGDGLTKSVPFDGHTYALTVELNTPIEEITLPTELGVTVERTTITTQPEKDEVQDSGEVPKDTAPTDEPASPESEDKIDADTSIADDSVKSEPTDVEQEPVDTDTTVSGNEPATPSEIEPAPAPEDKPDEVIPPADEEEQETTVTKVMQETIPVTWKGDRAYTPDQNSKVIYTAQLPEGYALKDGVALPQIYVMVGRQARAGTDVITVSINGNATPVGGATLQAAITASGVVPAAVTSLKITAGEVTTADWKYLKNLTALTTFEIDSSIANDKVANIPDGNSALFPASIVSVTVPQEITIGNYAFNPCTTLATISFPNATSIGDYAFSECTLLDTASFPKATRISFGAFGNCTALTAASFPKATSIEYGTFAGCTLLDTASFPAATTISDVAFENCTALTTASFPVVTSIGASAFSGCTALNTLNLGATPPETVAANAFYQCPTPRALGYLAADGSALTADTTPTLAAAQTAYGKVADDDSDVTTWYGWATGAIAGPSITVDTQIGAATYGTTASPTFDVTSSSFDGSYPAFAPSVAWTGGTTPTGVTTAFTENNTKLTLTTTAATPAGEHKFKVVSAKAQSEGGNYESAEATLTVDKLEATIAWGSTVSFPYNGSAQAPTATVSNKVGSDDVTVTVTGAQTNVGTNYTATADALTGTAAGNYKLADPKLTTTFSITKAAYTGTQATAPDASKATKTDSTITLEAQTITDETVEYGIKQTDGTIRWQDSNVFTGVTASDTLAVNTEYTFFARVKANDNHEAGATSTGTAIRTSKTNYSGTAASAPNSTPTAKTDTSVTLAPVTPPAGENVQYAKSTTSTAPTDDAAWQDSATFDGLSPNTAYFFFARVKENDTHAAGGVSSPGTSITTDKSEYTTKVNSPSGTPASKTDTGITLAPVTPPDGETVQYGYSTDGSEPTTWQDSTAFSGLDSNKEYTFFARVKENTTHKAGPASTGTKIKTDKSDADKLADAKAAVTAALNGFTATNAADADAMIALANKAISDAGITGVTTSWDASGAFSKTEATEDTAGSVTGTIKLTCGGANDTVVFDKTIAKLPSDPNAKIATVKAAIEAALNSYTATNATTAADIKAIVDKANTDTGITGVTVAWGTPSFNNTNSTNSADGKVTGSFNLSCTSGGSSANDTVSFNRPIERSDEQKLADAKSKVAAALAAMTATNATTDADVLTAVNNALSGTGVTAAWKTGSGFDKTLATKDASGLITGVIELTLNGKKSDANVNLIIAQLAGDKKALTDAITDANNAKNGIVINNGSPSSVASGTKFVSDAEMKAFTDAIAAAQTVANKPNATEAEITAAVTALNNAITTFKAAFKTGTYTPSSGGGGGGGSSSGGSGSSPIIVPPTTTTPNPPTTVETKVPATVDKNGNATVSVTDKTMQDAIDKAVAEAKKNGTSGNGVAVVISVTTGGKDANTVTVNLPKTVQEKVIAGNVVNTIVVVDRPDIAINMNLATITEINKQAKADVQLSATRMDNSKLSADAKTAIGNRPTFDLKATYAGGTKAVTSFGTGSVTIEIPYALQKGEVVGGLYAVYVDGNGKVSYITNSSYDANAKVLRFATNHFSVYGIGYKAPSGFTDIAGHWAKDDIEYVVNRGLFSGTSSTTFAPNGAMTRGMFVTALGRLAGADVSSYKTSSFSDVKADAYYMGYIEWASKNGIVKGIGEGKFAPDQSITREQMAVIIESYAKAIGYTMPNVHAENTFADSAKIGTWAKDSVKKVQMAGVISGKSNNVFDPQGTATRAEVSAVLHRFIEIVISTDTAQGWTMNDSGKWMYYENGKAITGKKTIAGKSYEFNTTGELIEGNNNPETGGPITSGYTVVKDDSWWRIAKKYNVNMFTLAKINGKTIFSIIHPGDVLQIPQ